MKRWYIQSAELLFEHSDDDNKEYLVGVYIPAFDSSLGSNESLDDAVKDFTENGIVIKGRSIQDFIRMFSEPISDIENIAKIRQDIHGDYSTKRLTTNKYYEDTVGVAGEVAFAKMFNCEVDKEARAGGDGGVDFTINGKTIDVKTAKKPYNILVKVSEINRVADIIVLAKYNDDKSVSMIGWATKEEMKLCQTKIFNPVLGIESHYKNATTLRAIKDLFLYLNPPGVENAA